ncbi:MAG: hypothetical protein ACE37H_05595 [Phycisphaeraceae bacterium]
MLLWIFLFVPAVLFKPDRAILTAITAWVSVLTALLLIMSPMYRLTETMSNDPMFWPRSCSSVRVSRASITAGRAASAQANARSAATA